VQGLAGDTGVQGIQGLTGATGATGNDGLTGLTGATGAQGNIGLTGATGAAGNIGLTGATGAAGNIGLTGATGAQGNIGLTGATGAAGATGVGGTTVTSGTASPGSTITVPTATMTLTYTSIVSSASCAGSATGVQPGCLYNAQVNAAGSVTTTISGFTGCTAAATQKVIVTPRNLPAGVELQNVVCNGVGTAAVTLLTWKTNGSISVPTSTVFQYFLIP
jgi:hypothetical protein